ncbi:aromatic acid exporter family protein [Bacillaceae bacterium S4-13-58]
MKFGARIIKTGLAVALALYTAKLLGLPSPIFSGIAAVFSIQPSIYRSYQNIIEQVQANIIGALSATIIVLLLGNDPFIIGLTIVLVIASCLSLKMKESTIMLAVVAVMSIMESTQMDFLTFAGIRFSSIMIGIFAAFLINLLFLPPKYETKLFGKIDFQSGEVLKWLRVTTRHLSDHPSLKTEIENIQKGLIKIDQTYLLFQEERNYFKKVGLAKARKLVVFRQLILTLKKSFEVLRAFYDMDYKLGKMPESFQLLLIQELDKVINAHETLLLMCLGRIRYDDDFSERVIEADIEKIVKELASIFHTNHFEKEELEFLPLTTKLMEYSKQVSHLERLLSSYQQFHQKEQFNVSKEEI